MTVPSAAIVAVPKTRQPHFTCFWANGTGWGTYSLQHQNGSLTFSIRVLHGALLCRSIEMEVAGVNAAAHADQQALPSHVTRKGNRAVVHLKTPLSLGLNKELRVEIGS